MLKRTLVAVASGAIVIGAVVISSTPAGAVVPSITGSGDVSCHGAGMMKFKAPLTNTAGVGTRTTTTVSKVTCTETTTDAVTVVSGKVISTMTAPATGTCAVLGREQVRTVTTDVKWKGVGGKVQPTHIVWTSVGGNVAGLKGAVSLPGTTGSATVTGSFAGDDASSAAITTQTVVQINAACAGKGLKKLNLGPTSSLDLFAIPDLPPFPPGGPGGPPGGPPVVGLPPG